MAVNSLFSATTNLKEQSLISDLVAESIQIMGQALNYIPRNSGNIDPLYLEDTISTFSSYSEIEMFVVSSEGFEGDQEFLSKFSIEIPNQMKLVVAKVSFEEIIGGPSGIVRPREGDLIHLPFNDDVFQISFVDDKLPWFQFGAVQMYTLTVEKFRYSHETFNTGLATLDSYIQTIDDLVEDPFADNVDIQSEADSILDFSEMNPFSENGF